MLNFFRRTQQKRLLGSGWGRSYQRWCQTHLIDGKKKKKQNTKKPLAVCTPSNCWWEGEKHLVNALVVHLAATWNPHKWKIETERRKCCFPENSVISPPSWRKVLGLWWDGKCLTTAWGRGGWRGALICRSCSFQWCEYPHHRLFQSTNMMSLNAMLGGAAK